MLDEVARVLLCLGVGEVVARLGLVPVPGPVLGLLLLYLSLTLRGSLPDDLGALADRVLQVLGMLFVPAGVGVIAYLDLLRTEIVPIVASVVGGTAITILVTAAVAKWFSAPVEKRAQERAPEQVEGGAPDVRV